MSSLAVARAGDESTHETWSAGRAGRFALLAGSYASDPVKWRDGSDFHHHEKGLKYQWFYSYLKTNPWVFDFDAVWLVDDDIAMDSDSVADMFDIFHERDLWIAQPSIRAPGQGSHQCGFPILTTVRGSLLRHLDSIEEQAPIFSKEALKRIWKSFGANQSGWGLRLLWKHELKAPVGKVGVIDAVVAQHTREAGTGPMYKEVLSGMKISAKEEYAEILRRHNNESKLIQLGSVPLDPNHPKTEERLRRQGALYAV